MKVRFNKTYAESFGWEFPSLTDGKIYDVEDTVDWPDMDNDGGNKRYMLVEDDHDEQEFYDIRVFDVVEEGK